MSDYVPSNFTKRVRSELVPPACSFSSRTSDDEWFIDCAYDVDYFGVFYIGKKDFDEMCRVVGYPTAAEKEDYENRIKELISAINLLESERNSLLEFKLSIISAIKEKRSNDKNSKAVRNNKQSESDDFGANEQASEPQLERVPRPTGFEL